MTNVLKLRSDTFMSSDALKAQSSWHKYVQSWSVGWHTRHVHACWDQPNPDMHADMSHTNATLRAQHFLCVILVRISTFCKSPCDFLCRTAVTCFLCRTQLISMSDLLESFPHILSTIILQIVTYFLQETQLTFGRTLFILHVHNSEVTISISMTFYI
jgi:hypothetical protein